MKKVAAMLKRRFENIITYLTHPITNATSESINAKIQWVKYTAPGSCCIRSALRRESPAQDLALLARPAPPPGLTLAVRTLLDRNHGPPHSRESPPEARGDAGVGRHLHGRHTRRRIIKNHQLGVSGSQYGFDSYTVRAQYRHC